MDMTKQGDAAPDIRLQTDTAAPSALRSEGQERRAVLLPEGQHARLHRGGLRIPRRIAIAGRPRRGCAASPPMPRPAVEVQAKYDLPFTLLCDVDQTAAAAYGVWKEKSMYGRKVMGIERTTFLIGKDGRIKRIFSKVKPKGHAAEVLEALSAL